MAAAVAETAVATSSEMATGAHLSEDVLNSHLNGNLVSGGDGVASGIRNGSTRDSTSSTSDQLRDTNAEVRLGHCGIISDSSFIGLPFQGDLRSKNLTSRFDSFQFFGIFRWEFVL